LAGSASGFCDTVTSADTVLAGLLPNNGFGWSDGRDRRRRSHDRRQKQKESAGVITAISDNFPQFHWIAFTIDLVVAFQMLLWYPTALSSSH
jgi:hypothetical protein